MGIQAFINEVELAANKLREREGREVTLIFHDDADGICSGAAVKWALEDLGYDVELLPLERLLVDVIRKVHSAEGRIIVYADMGSPHADLISRLNGGRNFVLILDHHDPAKVEDPNLINLNPELYGMRGEEDASGSTVSYLFASRLNSRAKKLAYLALIG